MYRVSAQGVDEHMINVHYYYDYDYDDQYQYYHYYYQESEWFNQLVSSWTFTSGRNTS